MGLCEVRCRMRKLASVKGNEDKERVYITGRLRSDLRRVWLRSDLRQVALNRGRVRKSKGRGYWYPCEQCGRVELKSSEVQIDHVVDCGKLSGFDDLGEWTARLFCPSDQLRRLCKPCHDVKTHNHAELL